MSLHMYSLDEVAFKAASRMIYHMNFRVLKIVYLSISARDIVIMNP